MITPARSWDASLRLTVGELRRLAAGEVSRAVRATAKKLVVQFDGGKDHHKGDRRRAIGATRTRA
jgi:hypothetical protein